MKPTAISCPTRPTLLHNLHHPTYDCTLYQALEMEPSMSPDIVGAWWYPQDMSIDAQRMFRVLEQACSKGGVEILQG